MGLVSIQQSGRRTKLQSPLKALTTALVVDRCMAWYPGAMREQESCGIPVSGGRRSWLVG
jgi:hypothetical protein